MGGVRGRVGLHWGRPIIDTGLNFLSVKTVSEDDLQLRRLMIPITIYCYDCSNGMTDKENIEKKIILDKQYTIKMTNQIEHEMPDVT